MGAQERSACGVGFVASREGLAKHAYLEQALRALVCVEHRGGCLADGKTGDGAGIMTEVPFELLGYPRGQVAVAQLFMMLNAEGRRQALSLFEATFNFMGL
jgi:glutamate synthase domain-containing protein 1